MAFKKPLSSLKNSAPIHSSDRRKLKARIVQAFSDDLRNEEPQLIDELVPEGLLSAKFINHLEEPGTAYLAPNGNPLWFTIGKGSDDLIPTVYTLWKRPSLLPRISTPSAVIPILEGGADLMIPGVASVLSSPTLPVTSLLQYTLVSITQYAPGKQGFPLAVGHLALSGELLKSKVQARNDEDRKGKAVLVLHTVHDKLWNMGEKTEAPEPVEPEVEVPETASEATPPPETPLQTDDEESAEDHSKSVENETALANGVDEASISTPVAETTPSQALGESGSVSLSKEEVSSILRTSLIHAIGTTLSELPPSTYPISSTTFYTTYILPSRPAYLFPSHSTTTASTTSAAPDPIIDIKHSSHKSLTHFLKSAEKEGLLRLKDVSKANKELQILAVFPLHDLVLSHEHYRTIGEVDARREKREGRQREEREREEEGRRGLKVEELWRPSGVSGEFFRAIDKDTSTLYTLPEIKTFLTTYISSKSLTVPRQQQLINVGSDELLSSVLTTHKGVSPDRMKREEIIHVLTDKMQAWHRIEGEGLSEPLLKKGQLKSISVVIKIRQGRKACTLITNFEPYLLTSTFLAEELRKRCASSTSVTPLPGKSAGEEVMVQGKQLAAVKELLMSKGVPEKRIECADLSGKK